MTRAKQPAAFIDYWCRARMLIGGFWEMELAQREQIIHATYLAWVNGRKYQRGIEAQERK